MDYPGGKSLSFSYDSNGRRLSSVDQLGHTLNYSYDVAGRLQSMTNELNTLVVAYQYDAAGRVALKTLGNGMFTTYQYDPAGHLLDMTNFLANSTVISRFNYTYDSRGRRVTMGTLDGNWTYTYDDIGQLTHAVYAAVTTNIPNQDLTYIYDSVGNRTQTIENGVATSYTVNNLNQYFSVGQTNYTFDADGNLTKEVSPQGTTTYTYNDENHLASITSPQGTWSYSYDGLGDRLGKTENGSNSRYVVDPIGLGNVVGEYDGAGNLIAHYNHAFGLIGRVDAANVATAYAFDGAGNVQQMIAGNGVANNYVYAPFGGILRSVEGVPNPFEFGGAAGVQSEGSGWTFMRARFYSPSLGRFDSRDPIGLMGRDLNLYRFTKNSPVMHADPAGTWMIGGSGPGFEFSGGYDPNTGELILCGGASTGTPFGGYLTGDTDGNVNAGLTLFDIGVSYTTDSPEQGWYGNAWGGGGIVVGSSGSWSGNGPKGSLSVGWGLGYGVGTGWCFRPDFPALPPEAGNPYGPGLPPFSVCIACPSCCSGGPPTPPRTPTDPNQMTGPGGYGPNDFIASVSALAYRIDFENVTNATAPAQQVIITDQLSTNFDWTTFNVSEFGFGDMLVSLPPGVQQLQTNVPFSYLGTNFQVQIQVGINPASGLISAAFRSIDPTTSLPPPVNIGFLPPEDGTGRGQGHVTYTIHAKAGLPTGTQLRNVALISFDNQPSIATDQVNDLNPAAGTDPTKEVLITLDSVAPTSHVLPLPAQSQLLQVPVSWIGQDDASGSGIASYDIYVSDNGGAWALWQSAATTTSATFKAQAHHTYGFYSRAHDNAGNVEAAHLTADATTTVVANPLLQLTVTPAGTNLNLGDTFNYTINVKNSGSLNLNNVSLSNTVPAGLEVDWISYGRGSCDIEDDWIDWSLGNLTTNKSAAMVVTATAIIGGTWTNLFSLGDSDGAAFAASSQVITVAAPAPVLTITLVSNQVVLSWPVSAGSYILQMAPSLPAGAIWVAVTNVPVVVGDFNTVTLPITGTKRFFRLLNQSYASPTLLSITLSRNHVALSWPVSGANYVLQTTTNLVSQASWVSVTNTPTAAGSLETVTLPVTGTRQFFRLKGQ